MAVRVVFDTNIWIAGTLKPGIAYQCLSLAHLRIVEPVYAQPMAAELAEKLRFTFHFTEHDIRRVMYKLSSIGTRVELPNKLRVVAADPDDDMFIECAVVANAPYIVSQDNHLLRIRRYEHIQIVSAPEFLDIATRF